MLIHDDELDKKLESGDDIMKSIYASDGTNPTNNQILVSNMITACIILKGIGGSRTIWQAAEKHNE